MSELRWREIGSLFSWARPLIEGVIERIRPPFFVLATWNAHQQFWNKITFKLLREFTSVPFFNISVIHVIFIIENICKSKVLSEIKISDIEAQKGNACHGEKLYTLLLFLSSNHRSEQFLHLVTCDFRGWTIKSHSPGYEIGPINRSAFLIHLISGTLSKRERRRLDNWAWIFIIGKNYQITVFHVLIRSKETNDLKFKTRETATTTSPRRHRERFNVRKTTYSVNCEDVIPGGLRVALSHWWKVLWILRSLKQLEKVMYAVLT